MKSIKYLNEQVEHYKNTLLLIEKEQEKHRKLLLGLQEEYDNIKTKYENYKSLLEMVEGDFEKYGWNPAG